MTADVGRIFVVGCPRSGTTLVQSLLACHSKIVAFTESHLFDKGFRSLGASSFVRQQPLKEYAAKFVSENEHLPETARARLLTCDQVSNAEEVGRGIVASFDETAQACGAACWVEKTPDHVFRIALIRSVAPHARFVHVIRRAEGVLPSLYLASREWGRNKSWLSCALHWTAALWSSALYAHGPTHFVVVYEDLLENRQAITQGLISWLGLEWEASIPAQYHEAAAKCIAAGETWKSANLRDAPPDPVSLRVPLARVITRLGPYRGLRRRSLRV